MTRARKQSAATAAKVSISLGADELVWARAQAKRNGKSLSAIMAEALRKQRQAEARTRLLQRLGASDITEADLAAVRAEWHAAGWNGPR